MWYLLFDKIENKYLIISLFESEQFKKSIKSLQNYKTKEKNYEKDIRLSNHKVLKIIKNFKL